MTDIPPTPNDLDDGAIPLTDLSDEEALEVIEDVLGLRGRVAHAYLAMAHGDPHPGLVEVDDAPGIS